MNFIADYVKSSVLGIVIGMILLIVAIVFLPESMTYKIFNVLKPKLLSGIKNILRQ